MPYYKGFLNILVADGGDDLEFFLVFLFSSFLYIGSSVDSFIKI